MSKLNYEMTLPFLIAVAGCSSDPVDIGSDKTGANLSDYAASWDGYSEAYDFGGSDRVRIALDASGNGTIEFGDAPDLPPPTDPDIGYPPGMGGPNLGPPELLTPGFGYPVHEAAVENRRIRFTVNPAELVQAWCQMQTPILDELNSTPAEPVYGCVPNLGFGTDEQGCWVGNTSFDCGKLSLCGVLNGGSSCVCDASGCDIRPIETIEQYPVRLDAALEAQATELVGTLLVGGERVIVRLTRQ